MSNHLLTSTSIKVDVHHPLLSLYLGISLGPRLEKEMTESLMRAELLLEEKSSQASKLRFLVQLKIHL